MDDRHAALGPARASEHERGSAAAEFAVTMPAVLLVLAMTVGALGAAAHQVRLADAAADAARALGRGESAAAAGALAARVAPGSQLATSTDGELVCAEVAKAWALPGGRATGIRLVAYACALGGGR
ncbi:TadE family type IV pilus minor pilin [Leifsonia sp. ALI-44-B]|uniref:TadE family type IV pilus minor pilin n=1 Tax=Leifsonia sp. ALI-44-B TaxID=1933776 RepID=UPI0009F8A6B3